ncbi:thioesterase-like superfamily-domain-containing protein [Xylaria intraflava]|nr:thioesterase-like superfamily-domain-containing protein [Xylaria intraflava]
MSIRMRGPFRWDFHHASWIKRTPSPVPLRRPLNAALYSGGPQASGLPALPPPRWVSDVRTRIGKCISFGCDAAQVERAAGILGVLAREWRVLTGGSEGFLPGGQRGLENQQVVWGEMDSFGHVNNANYIRYAESSRTKWIWHFGAQDPAHRDEWLGIMQPKGIGLILKSIKADYKFPMKAPDTISVYHKLAAYPGPTDTSLSLECVILSHKHRRVAARTFEDVTIYDYEEAKKTELPGFMLDRLRDTWEQQNQQAGWARGRVRDLLGDVERLEKETWDREDAVEDFGTAWKAS